MARAPPGFPRTLRLDPHRPVFEPRGHDMMSGGILYPPTRDDADIGILFIETSAACRCAATARSACHHRAGAWPDHAAPARQVLKLEVPAGLVDRDLCPNGPYVDSGPHHQHRLLSPCDRPGHRGRRPGLGEVTVDVAYGGNFYAIVEPQGAYTGLDDLGASRIVDLSRTSGRWCARVRAGASARRSHPRRQPCAVGRQARATAPTAATRSSTASARSTAAPAARAPRRGWRIWSPRAASRSATFRPRKLYRQPLHRPRRGGDRGHIFSGSTAPIRSGLAFR
jgi:proline racemase